MEASFRLQHVWGLWGLCLLESLSRKLRVAAVLALGMEFCAESPHWLYKRGRSTEAEAAFEKLLGGSHVKSAMAELLKSDRGDGTDTIKLSELLYGRYFRVVFIGSTLYALQQLSGINAVFYFSSTVFKSAGVPSNLANTCVGLANLSVAALNSLKDVWENTPPNLAGMYLLNYMDMSNNSFDTSYVPPLFSTLTTLYLSPSTSHKISYKKEGFNLFS